jgi:signal transduction histidine kinase/FixJ family two-component response regulator
LKNLVRKILAAFVLVSVAIALALVINRYSFRELLGTVNKLSEPNEKLIILNNLFQQVTTLDQTQREEAIKNPRKPYQSFLEQSASLNLLIDSLRHFEWDTLQLQKLNEMKGVLAERNELFFRYLKVKADLLDNKDFAIQLDTLTAILKDDEFTMDSSLITRKKTVTTTFLRDSTPAKKPVQQSLLKKIFSKKKKPVVVAADTQKVKIEQELSVIKDTAAIARQNEAARDIEKIIRAMESDQLLQRKKLQRQEMELIHANSIFVNQLLSILHDVENDEYHQLQTDNHHAVSVMNQSISRTNILMLSFFVAAAVLVYLIWIDIGRSNYYKEQLEKARDEAEELSQIKQRFLANMSHEIRTPLQSIIGFAEQLKQKQGYRPGEVDAIYSSSEHLLQIVNEVLDYSRISSGTFTLAKEKLDLLQLVDEVGSAMRVQAESKDLELIIDCTRVHAPAMVGDPFRLRQILYNILGNAIKFTHQGSIQLTVKTEERNDRILASFDITDTGIGMKKEELEKIFNQFEQANLAIARQYGGTGLGLTIVKALVETQGGTIHVDSEPHKGTSFHITLPFEKETGLRPSIAVSGTQPATSFYGKVMVVDDDSLILQLCSLILKKNGIAHSIFHSPEKALQQTPDPETTFILLDIRMPGMNGVELCRELKKKYPKQTRFIALTAHVLSDERSSLQKDGFDNVLPKPFHEQELLKVLGYASPPVEAKETEEPDLSLLHKMTLNDEALFQSILTQFVEETGQDLQTISSHLSNNDSKALREIVHKMAGRFAQIGMNGLADGLHTLEKKLVAGYSAEMLSTEVIQVSKKIKTSLTQLRRSMTELHS